jgi:hypothetical protein
MATPANVKSLITDFNTQLDITIASYADSKINNDTVYEQNVDKLYGILAQLNSLQDKTSAEIAQNDELLQGVLSKFADVQGATQQQKDDYGTVKQTLDDTQSTYDKNKFILLLKLSIVAFIFMKGNDIYVRNAYLFIGLVIVFISIYGFSLTRNT